MHLNPNTHCGARAHLARIALRALILLCMNSAALAERYMPSGVAEDDVLNLRAAPAATAALISSIPSSATLIIATGHTQAVRGQTWREVRYQGVLGWVNGRYLKPFAVPEPQGVLAEPLQCRGTEPHWTMKSEANGQLALCAPILGKAIPLIAEPAQVSVNHSNRWFADAVTVNGEQPAAIALHESGSCSDGMSNARYRFAVSVKLRGGLYLSGCCNRIDKP